MSADRDAYCLDEFCKRHEISKAFLYLLWRRGEGPRFMQVGAKRLISQEAGADWRRAMEKASEEIAA
jgi:hypothetical protein